MGCASKRTRVGEDGPVPIVSDYWAGVLQRLQAEVSVFAQLVAHEGERGRENEAVLERILAGFVPQRYGIGSGLLIDSNDSYSRQTDIVLFDQSDEPRMFAQTTQLLFPVENVLASIEVKTTLRGSDITDCFGKARDLRKLHPCRTHPDGTSHPLFVILAYRAGQLPETIIEKLSSAEPEERPDLVCVIEQGIVAGSPQAIRLGGTRATEAGLALVLDADGHHVEAAPTGPDATAVHNGKQYPIVRHRGASVLADPARALLLFVESLVRLVALQQGRPAPAMSHYVTEAMRNLAWHEHSA